MAKAVKKPREKAKAGISSKPSTPSKTKVEKTTPQNSNRPVNEEYFMALLHTVKQPLDFESAAKELSMNKVTCQTRYSRLKKIYYPGEVKSITKKKKRDVTSTAGAASDKTDATDSPETHDSDMELEDATD